MAIQRRASLGKALQNSCGALAAAGPRQGAPAHRRPRRSAAGAPNIRSAKTGRAESRKIIGRNEGQFIANGATLRLFQRGVPFHFSPGLLMGRRQSRARNSELSMSWAIKSVGFACLIK